MKGYSIKTRGRKMIRYTPTKLERIIQVFEGRVDKIVDKTCRDLDSLKYDPITDRLNKKWMKGVREAFNQATEAHSRTLIKQEMDRHFYQSKVWDLQMAPAAICTKLQP